MDIQALGSSCLTEREQQQLLQLWNQEYPSTLSYTPKEFHEYLAQLDDLSHLFIVDESGNIQGWYFDFIREEARWFGMMLDRSIQGKGWGSQLLGLAKQKRNELNGWVIDQDHYLKNDGTQYSSPLPFYLKNGFNISTSERLELKYISAVKINYSTKFNT